MLIASPPLLRALLAAPPPAGFARGADPDNAAPAPVQPSFALVAAGYGFGPLRGTLKPRPARKRNDRQHQPQN